MLEPLLGVCGFTRSGFTQEEIAFILIDGDGGVHFEDSLIGRSKGIEEHEGIIDSKAAVVLVIVG